MKSSWDKIKFDEIIDILTDYHANGSYKILKENVELFDIPNYAIMIRTTNFESGLDNTTFKYISEDAYNYLKKTKVYSGDIIMNKIANPGTAYYMPDLNRPVSLAMNLFLIRVDKNKALSKYIYYYLKVNEAYVKSFALGSVTQTITKQAVRNLVIDLPNIKIQKKIINIIGGLDDKIELNRKMNQTLEQMAQALFKSWFVDFDPVKVKAKCSSDEELEAVAKELGISKEILELFPSEFEDSELGMIPKGWKNNTLSHFVEILDSKRIPLAKNERAKRQGQIPYYGATSIMDYIDDFIFNEPLTLMGEDGSVVRDDGTPFMQYIWGKAWINNHAHVIKSKSSLSTEAIYIALLKQNVTRFVTGAVQPKINQRNLKQIPIIEPTENLHQVYSELIAPMFSKIRQLTDETKTLTKTRDTLLPKLLSGEVEV